MSNVRVTRTYRKHRQYTPEFKAQLVAESQNPGAFVSRIALDNDLNANLLRRWMLKKNHSTKKIESSVVVKLIWPLQLLDQVL